MNQKKAPVNAEDVEAIDELELVELGDVSAATKGYAISLVYDGAPTAPPSRKP